MDRSRFQRVFHNLPELQTDRLILRRIKWQDAQDMNNYTTDSEVSKYVLWDKHESMSDTLDAIRSMRRQYRLGRPASYAIIHKETARMIGTIGFMWIDVTNRSGEIGYSLSREYWNQGYATEALRKLIDFSFKTLKLHRVEAQYDIRNQASGRVMQKAGMNLEGTLHDRLINKGEYCTVSIYAIINPEE